jgi:hypothetical protein
VLRDLVTFPTGEVRLLDYMPIRPVDELSAIVGAHGPLVAVDLRAGGEHERVFTFEESHDE